MGQPLSVEIRIAARQESLVFHPVGVSIDALIIEAKRQLDALMGSYWKWLRFPVHVELNIAFDGKVKTCSFIGLTLREMIARAKIILEGMLKNA